MSTAMRAFVTSVVVVGVVVGAFALWHLRLLVFLLFLGLTLAAAMRPGVDKLCSHGVPRSVGVSAVGLLLGGVYVLLAVPLASLLATLSDVFVMHRNPAREEVPTVIFPAKDSEA